MPLHDKAGRIIAIEGVLTDISERKHIEARVHFTNALLASELECSPDGILVVDGNARIVSVNQRFLDMWQISPDLISGGAEEPLPAAVQRRCAGPGAWLRRTSRTRRPSRHASATSMTIPTSRPATSSRPRTAGSSTATPGHCTTPRAAISAGSGSSATSPILKQVQQALAESEEKFRTIVASVNEGIFLVDPDTGTFVDVNPPGCTMFGYAREELIGREISIISSDVPPYTQGYVVQWHRKARTIGPQTFEWHCKAKDGHLFWGEVSIRSTALGGRNMMLATVRDITDRKRIESELVRMARYDGLTGLANRVVFLERLGQAIARARRGSTQFSMLYLDLDHFKDVNDTLGHPLGDALLRAVADRLLDCVRKTDLVARFGGDEFAVLQENVTDPEGAESACRSRSGIPFLRPI